MLYPPGFYHVKKTKMFVILSSDKSSERNLSCFFDIIKPRRIEHLQKKEPFSSEPYFNMIFFPLCVHERKSYVNGRRVSGNHVCTVYYQMLQGSQNRWVLEEFCFYIFKISYRFLCFKTRMIRCLEAEGSPIVGWDFFRIGLSIAVCLVVGRPFATWAIKARMNTVWKAQLISKPYARVRLCLKKKWEKALEIMTNPFYTLLGQGQ